MVLNKYCTGCGRKNLNKIHFGGMRGMHFICWLRAAFLSFVERVKKEHENDDKPYF